MYEFEPRCLCGPLLLTLARCNIQARLARLLQQVAGPSPGGESGARDEEAGRAGRK